MPSTPARSLDVNVLVLSPVVFSAERIVPGTVTSSARAAAPLVMQKRHGGDDLWRNMAARGDRIYWRSSEHRKSVMPHHAYRRRPWRGAFSAPVAPSCCPAGPPAPPRPARRGPPGPRGGGGPPPHR